MLHFDELAHRYYWMGQPVPNVTGVLERAGLYNFGTATREQLEDARELGRAIHKVTELHDRGTLDDASVHPVLVPYLAAWRRFVAETEFEIELIEQRVYNTIYRYAGTLDRAGHMRLPAWRGQAKSRALLDIKRGVPQRATGPQTAAYQYCDGSTWRGCQRFAVYLQDDGTYKVEHHNDPNDWSVFLAALSIYNWRGAANG